MQQKRSRNRESRAKGALVVAGSSCENGERSSQAVRKNYFCENLNRNENSSYTSLLLLSPSSSSPSSSSIRRENSLIHSSCGVRSINSVIDSDNAIFNQHSCDRIDSDQWDHHIVDCNLNSRGSYSIHLTCNDPDLVQSNQDNVNGGVWNVDSVGVSKLRTPSNLCKSNRQVPIIRKLTPKVKAKKNDGFECNVIVEQQQHETKIAQLSSVIKQNDNVKSNDGIDDDDNDDNFTVRSHPTADVRCLSSTLYNDNLIVCDDRVDASECSVKNAENRIVCVEEGCLNGDGHYRKQNFQSNFDYNGFDDCCTVKRGLNSDGFVKDRCQYKKISPQGNRRFANSTGSASLAFLGGNRQYCGIYVSTLLGYGNSSV